MANLPSMRLVIWNSELGVGVIFTSMPFLAKKPFSCATQIGQLKPPGKTIRLTAWRGGCGAAGAMDPLGEAGARDPEGPPAHDARNNRDAATTSVPNLVMSPPHSGSFAVRCSHIRSAMRPCHVALFLACSSVMRGALSASPA